MVEKEKLQIGVVYPIMIKGEDYGRCLYLCERGAVNTTQEIRPRFHAIVLVDKERGLDLKFTEGEYKLKEGVLHLKKKTLNTWCNPLVGRYLEGRLEKAGL